MLDIAKDMMLLEDTARQAGRIAMRYFDPSHANEVWTKKGDSPVSEADFAVDDFLRHTLLEARPGYGWLSEETEDDAARLTARRTFVVDPIDGTRGFLEGRRQWCISIAIVEEGRPVAALLECPAMDRTFSALANGPARLNGTDLPRLATDSIRTVTASRKLNALIEQRYRKDLKVHPFVPSLAYRIAMVAAGEIDAAFARPGAHDWDLAAADLVLTAAGGMLTDVEGRRLTYNQAVIRSDSLLASGISNHSKLMNLAKSGGFLH